MAKPQGKISMHFTIGTPQTFELHVKFLTADSTVSIEHERPGVVVWNPTKNFTPDSIDLEKSKLTFTSTPTKGGHASKHKRPQAVGGDGEVTITVTNPDGDDPQPIIIFSNYANF
jgi:hypothetical protein